MFLFTWSRPDSEYKWLHCVLVCFCCVVAIVEGFSPVPRPRLWDSRVVFSPVWPNCVLHERQVELQENPGIPVEISRHLKVKMWHGNSFSSRKEISELTHKAMNGNVKFQADVRSRKHVCNRLIADSPKPVLSDVSQHHRSMVRPVRCGLKFNHVSLHLISVMGTH